MMISALPVDIALPGIDRLHDQQSLRESFRRCLRPELACCQIESCELIRFRYRRGLRFIAHYGVGVRDQTTDQISTQWLTVMTYADNGVHRVFDKMLAELPSITRHDKYSAFQPLSYLADDDLVIQAFPTDRYLPQIDDFLGDLPNDVIACMLDSFGPGNWKVSKIDIEPSRYRPLMGLTLRCRIEACAQSSDSQTRHFFVKLYRGHEGGETWQKLTQLRRDLSDYPCTFRLVGPGTWMKQHRALVLDQVPGQPLDCMLAITGTNIDQTMARVAKAMFEFHNSPLNISGKKLVDELPGRAEYCVDFIADQRPDFASVLMRIRTALRDTEPVIELRPAHCDLKAEHLLIDDSHVTFIDMDSAAMADPVYDLAIMLVRLQVMSTLEGVSRELTETAAESLLEHYFQMAPAGWRDRLPHQLGNAGIRVALFFVQHMIPDWAQRTRLLLDQIDALLNGTTNLIPGRSIP